VKQRRLARGLSQRQAARLAGDISPTTWLSLEKHQQPVSALTAAGICRALAWTPDSIQAILDGREPTEIGYVVGGAASGEGGAASSHATGIRTPSPEPIKLSAHGVDLDALREEDPEAYEAIMRQAEIALDRARERRPR
jgi:hypothetical protein